MSGDLLAARAVAPFGRLFDFRGRMRRNEIGPFALLLGFAWLAEIVLAFAIALPLGLPPLSFVFGIALLCILLAFAAVVRRLHDVGWSGLWTAAYVVLAAIFVGAMIYWRLRVIATRSDPSLPMPSFSHWPFLLLMPLSGAMNLFGLLNLFLCVQPGTAGPNRCGPKSP